MIKDANPDAMKVVEEFRSEGIVEELAIVLADTKRASILIQVSGVQGKFYVDDDLVLPEEFTSWVVMTAL